MQSFRDLTVSWNHPFSRQWNALISRLDSLRVDVTYPLTVERHATGTQIQMPKPKSWPYAGGGVAGLFPVNLSGTGGSSGDYTVPCSFVYNLYSPSDSSYGNPLNIINTSTGSYSSSIGPICSRARVFTAGVTSGSHGTAYYSFNGTIVLWDCDESIQSQTISVVTASGPDVAPNIVSTLQFAPFSSATSAGITSTFVFPDTTVSSNGIDSSGCIHVVTKPVTFLGVICS